MTHDKKVAVANKMFATLKYRYELAAMDDATLNIRPHPESDNAEIQDFGKDMQRVVNIEALGIGSAGDLFAIADVLLRAIDRQWAEDDALPP